ncbi:MAG: hypothetical protein M3Y65_19290 [Pseudomonadota bacterium]|nr:hypothetical protein [Pseudomonadota bacterium]
MGLKVGATEGKTHEKRRWNVGSGGVIFMLILMRQTLQFLMRVMDPRLRGTTPVTA